MPVSRASRVGCSLFLFVILPLRLHLIAQGPPRIIPVPDQPIARELKYKYDHLSPADGLPHFTVYDFLQDSQGYLWLGTEGGLTRFDGYQFKTFAHDPGDPWSPSSSVVYQVVESSFRDTSYIWFRTPEGMNRLNLLTEQTQRFIPGHDATTIKGYAYSSTNGAEGTFWVGSTNGLFRYDYHEGLFEHLLPGIRMEDIYRDSEGIIWIASDDDGLLGYHPETGEVEQYLHDPEDPSSISANDLVAHIFESDYLGPRYLWVGTDAADLNLFDKETGKFQRIHQLPYSLPDNAEPEFESTRFGAPELWLITYPKGLKVLNLQNGQLFGQQMRPDDPDGLFHDTVLEIFEDRSGVIWVGSFAGLDRLNRFEQVFHNLSHLGPGPDLLASDGIMGFCLDSNGKLWLGGKAGISILDPVTGTVGRFRDDPICPRSLKGDLILDIEEDQDENIWISGFSGVYRLDPQRREIRHYPVDWGTGTVIPAGLVNQFAVDHDGGVWMSSSRGIFRFLPGTDAFEQYAPLEELIAILSPQRSNSHLLFAGSRSGGLVVLDRINGEFRRFIAREDDPNSLSTNRIYSLFEGSDSTLWVGTNCGLDYARIVDGVHDSLAFRHYTMADGLPAAAVLSVQEDLQGRIWVGTQSGVAVLDSQTGRFRAYDEGDGIANANCTFNACARDDQGRLYFGTMEDLLVFHPDSLQDNPYIPPVVLTDFELFHAPVAIGRSSVIPGFRLPRSISYLDTLHLSYRENVFSLKFAALDFRNPAKNQYAYRLEGFDEDWIHTDAAHRRVTYTNLDPGEYRFQVRGSNNDGLWNTEGRSLTIIISPPWWLSGMAYLAYIFLVLTVMGGLWSFQLSRIRLRHRAELEHLSAERYKELDEMKSRFFANISHEFRTPLTLILGPIERLRQHIKDRTLREDLTVMQKHARYVLALVTQLLDLSKLDSGKMQLQASERNVIPLIRSLVLSFASMAERRNITLSFHSDLEEIRAYVEKDALVKILNNLLANAFKFTADGGEISAQVHSHPVSDLGPEGEFSVVICDNGTGIPADRLHRVFDRFYQVNNADTRDHEGSGIGLALTRELVVMHHGDIKVDSTEGSGTCFTIRFALGRAHLDDAEINAAVDGEGDESLSPGMEIPEPVAGEPAERGSTKPLLLIVEDNTDVRRFIRSYLCREHRCLEAMDGEQGLRRARRRIPDLIISDVMMPKMDGIELCQRIKSDPQTSHIPVILLTAKADSESRLEGLEIGADSYLTKPFDARELQVRVHNLIQQRQQLREVFQKELTIVPRDLDLSSMDQRFMEKVVKAVLQDIDNPDFRVLDLSRRVHMSRQHLTRKLQALTGLTTHEFIRSIRLKQAALRLRSGAIGISEVAFQVGFRDPSHFAKVFKEEFHQTPRQYLDSAHTKS